MQLPWDKRYNAFNSKLSYRHFFGADTFSKSTFGSEEAQPSGWFRSFTLDAYKPYFDVDTSDVLERIKESLFPFRGSFTEKTADSPDL